MSRERYKLLKVDAVTKIAQDLENVVDPVRDEAVSAKDQAVTARTGADNAKNQAETYRDQSLSHRNSAETFSQQSGQYRDQAETAKTASELARDDAEAARDASYINANAYSTTTEGLANTTDGEAFMVFDDTDDLVLLDLYENVSGEAVYKDSFPSSRAVDLANQQVYAQHVTFIAKEARILFRIQELEL